MKKAFTVLATLCSPMLLILAIALFGGPGTAHGPTDQIVPSALATSDIPASYLAAYQQAGTRYRIPWTVIAGIGKVECDHGRYKAAGCNPPGTVNQFGARGPMQFLGSTWDAARQALDLDVTRAPIPAGSETDGYATDCTNDNSADPWNINDAACATARMLIHNGYNADPRAAIYAYNHSDAYVTQVMEWSTKYDGGPALIGLAGYNDPNGWPLPSTHGRISYFGDPTECQSMALWQQYGTQGSCVLNASPTLRYFVAMRWPKPAESYPWYRKQRILLTLPRTGKAVVVVPGDWGPAIWTQRDFDVSKPAMDALGAQTDDIVDARWVNPSTPTGPVTGTAPTGTGQGLAQIDWDGKPGGATLTVTIGVAPQTAALVQAARRSGLPLAGSGWRSPQRQIELRSEPARGCGDGVPLSHYDIYEAPSSTCNPPTAPPGRSLHEQGLAIDFTCGGNSVSDGDRCHRWLVANARLYGYLPYGNDYRGSVEPWHWSTTGR